jgi:LysM repeat protein
VAQKKSVGAKVGTIVERAPRARRPGRIFARLLAPLVLLAVVAAVALIVTSPPDFGRHPGATGSHAVAVRRLRPYWTVRPGDTLAQISAKTGLSVELLQAYNPTVNPLALTPGERLNLWRYPPKPPQPKREPQGPMFWVVRPGQSFGSIAASTGINIVTLEQLNPQVKPASLQPGDRVRLRH